MCRAVASIGAGGVGKGWLRYDFDMNARNPTPTGLTHVNAAGEAHMVDVGGKAVTARTALAEAHVVLGQAAFAAMRDATASKGDVLGTARVAGIMAAKRCADLIPLCHSLPLSFAGIEFELHEATSTVRVLASCRTDHRTGVEMEAMTAASVAALTLYDMCKGVDKSIRIEGVRLLEKTGGKSGRWAADAAPESATQRPERESTQPTVDHAEGAGPTPASGTTPGDIRPTPAPAISLVYFARTAELTGLRQEAVAIAAPIDGHALLSHLEQRHPALAPAQRLHLAVNQEHVAASVIIRPGDEVAVFEPVTGG